MDALGASELGLLEVVGLELGALQVLVDWVAVGDSVVSLHVVEAGLALVANSV